MPLIRLGNDSVIEGYKPDEGTDVVLFKARKDLGRQVTTMSLNETDVDDKPSRAMNLAMAVRVWNEHSDKSPAWVEGDDDLMVALIADHFGCRVGKPKNWKAG
jgi:hypothetical protein